jgi:hypothetical protein
MLRRTTTQRYATVFPTAREAANYAEQVFEHYKQPAQIPRFGGAVAEVGPGGTAGVALLMRRDGCEQVDLIDRFTNQTDSAYQDALYSELSKRHDLDRFRVGERWNDRALLGITWYEGQPAERYFRSADSSRYDFIGSCAVLQSMYAPLGALVDMARCLRPGARMVHYAGLSDGGMFEDEDDELRWLSLPSWLWPLMTRYSGRRNRILVHRYRRVLDGLQQIGLISYEIRVTRLLGSGEVVPPRPMEAIDPQLRERAATLIERSRLHFTREFQEVDTLDLATTGICLVAQRLI